MTFFWGSSTPPSEEGQRQLERIASRYAGGPLGMWTDGHHRVLQKTAIRTPEDRYARIPLGFAGGRRVLLFDGRLDNRDDLVNALGLADDAPTLADSDVLAAALAHWGDAAIPRLEGDFAFAYWDRDAQSFLLACDPVGGRTLFYRCEKGEIVFSTAFQGLRIHGWGLDQVDPVTLGAMLIDDLPALGRTPFLHVTQMPPGSYLRWDAHGTRLIQGNACPTTEGSFSPSAHEHVEEARTLLDRAVRVCLRSEGRPAFMLSGGFDAAAVTATAARLLAPEPIHALTALPRPGVEPLPTSPHAFLDEWSHASAVARMYPNIHQHPCPAAKPEALDPTPLFRLLGRPLRNGVNISWFQTLREKAASLGAHVCLGGSSGNQTLSFGGSWRLAQLASQLRVGQLWRALPDKARWETFRAQALAPLLPPWIHDARRKLLGRQDPHLATSAIQPSLLATLRREGCMAMPPPSAFHARWHASRQMSRVRRSLQSLITPYCGFELRDPLGDIRLATFLMGLPSECFFEGGVSRLFARQVLADRLPASLLQEQRRGLQCHDWFDRLDPLYLREQWELIRTSPLAQTVLDLPRMKAVLDAWPQERHLAASQFPTLIGVLDRGISTGRFILWAESGDL